MTDNDEQQRVVPVAEEQLKVDTQRRVTGGVRVYKTVHEHQEVIDEPVRQSEVEVRRVAVDEFVDEPAETRREGDTTIIPVHEEVVVTERRLRLKEEIHIVEREHTRRDPRTVVVRREEAHVEQIDPEDESQTSQPS